MIEYEIKDNIVIAKTRYGNEFQFDLEDLEKIKAYNWRYNSCSGVYTIIDKKRISLTKILFNKDISYIYLDGNKYNYCKSNLQERGRTNKVIDYNGYNAIYFPEHHRAFKNGMVYEHILVAEKIIGRKLKEEEVVHHIDKDRKNNSKENLMIFKTDADHSAYHMGYEAIKENCVWYCPEAIINKNNIITKQRSKNNVIRRVNYCPNCGKEISKRSTYCKECWCLLINHKHNVQWPTKEELRELIFTKPFTQIAKMFGVTDNAVRKWCKNYGLPFRRKDIKLELQTI